MAKAEKPLATKTKHQILVVEDNDLNLKLFRDLLDSEGFSVIETKDGLDGFNLALNHIPDLIVMDIQLKGVSGLDIIRKMKTEEKIKHIPIIAVTAFAMKDDREKVLASGCEVYLAKPISIISFIATIKSHLKLL